MTASLPALGISQTPLMQYPAYLSITTAGISLDWYLVAKVSQKGTKNVSQKGTKKVSQKKPKKCPKNNDSQLALGISWTTLLLTRQSPQ